MYIPFLFCILENTLKNMKKAQFGIMILCVLLATGIVTYFRIEGAETSTRIIAPLPELLTRAFPGFGKSEVWKPRVEAKTPHKIKLPELSAHVALTYDLTSNTLLYEKDIHKRMPIASLTKIMTAIIALENEDLKKEITVSRKAAEIGENIMGLAPGEKITLKNLLYGLLLPSGNDAAEAIAESSKFGRENFVYLMNKKTEDLGLADTRFTNPSGLEGDGKQYSSAYDLLVITRYALENETFVELVSTVEHAIPESTHHKAFHLFNDTNLLTSYPGVKGVKTGFTNEAGMCLVSYLEYKGHKIIGIILNSQNRREEMKMLLDYSLRTLGIIPPNHS